MMLSALWGEVAQCGEDDADFKQVSSHRGIAEEVNKTEGKSFETEEHQILTVL